MPQLVLNTLRPDLISDSLKVIRVPLGSAGTVRVAASHCRAPTVLGISNKTMGSNSKAARRRKP